MGFLVMKSKIFFFRGVGGCYKRVSSCLSLQHQVMEKKLKNLALVAICFYGHLTSTMKDMCSATCLLYCKQTTNRRTEPSYLFEIIANLFIFLRFINLHFVSDQKYKKLTTISSVFRWKSSRELYIMIK